MFTRRRGDCQTTFPAASLGVFTARTRTAQPRARTLRFATDTRRWKTFGTMQRGPTAVAFGGAAFAVVVVTAVVDGALGGEAGGGALVVVVVCAVVVGGGGGGGGGEVVVAGGGGLEPSANPKSSAQYTAPLEAIAAPMPVAVHPASMFALCGGLPSQPAITDAAVG
jgi:hypothetical protein